MSFFSLKLKYSRIINECACIIIIILVAFLFQLPLFTHPGLSFYGDEAYYVIKSPFMIWESGIGPNINMELFSSLLLFSLAKLFGNALGVKIWYLIILSLSGLSMYYFIRFAIKKVCNDSFTYIISICLSLAYMLSIFNPGLIHPGSLMALCYAFFPLVCFSLIKYVVENNNRYLLLFSTTLLLGMGQPALFLYLLIFLIILVISVVILGVRTPREVIIKFLIIAIITILLNTYWILPLIVLISHKSSFLKIYSKTNLQELRLLSHLNMLDAIFLGYGEYRFFWLHPKTLLPFNIIFPLLIVLALLTYRKYIHDSLTKCIFITSLLLYIVSLFLVPGVNSSLGILYYIIVKYLPVGLSKYMRNPTKFITLSIFSYCVLAAYGVTGILHLKRRKIKYLFLYIALFLITLNTIYNAIRIVAVHTWPSYWPVNIPVVYERLSLNFLKIYNKTPFNVYWIPSGGVSYIWKPFIISGFPSYYFPIPSIMGEGGRLYNTLLAMIETMRHFLTSGNITKLKIFCKNLSTLMTIYGIKYIIFHNDCIGCSYISTLLKTLLVCKEFSLYRKITWRYCLKSPEFPIVFLQLSYGHYRTQGNSIFKLLNSELIREHINKLYVLYTVPSTILSKVHYQKFSSCFGMSIMIVPCNVLDFSYPVYGIPAYRQMILGKYRGIAVFKIKVPYYYPSNCGYVFAWFYDGNFRPITNRYYVGSIKIIPDCVNISFYIIVNRLFRGKIFAVNYKCFNEFCSSITDVLCWYRLLNRSTCLIVTNITKISPTKYAFVVKPNYDNILLVFSEPYSELWNIYSTNCRIKVVYHKNLFGINVFNIRILYNKLNECKFIIVNSLRKYFVYGLLITFVCLILIALIPNILSVQLKTKKTSKNINY